MIEVPKSYAIAEMFTSPQGEGMFAGTLMTFIRFGGCSVGKPNIGPVVHNLHTVGGEPTGHQAWQCRAWDGRHFWCDTDFNTRTAYSIDEIMTKIPDDVEHICLTGGEPMIHDLNPLVDAIQEEKGWRTIHIETSGTIMNEKLIYKRGRIPAQSSVDEQSVWITVSPKYGVRRDVLDAADEVKLLVDADFNLQQAQELMHGYGGHIFLQPINGEHSIEMKNVKRCLEIQKQEPKWKISVQLHKILNVR